MNLFRRRRVADLQAEVLKDYSLKRALGPINLTALGIGAVIGAGIFVLTGQAAAKYAGPAIVYSFILAGLACAFAGLCYAEFSAMIPISGSAYTYGYATLGEFVAWIIGWDLILEYLFAASTVAVGWSGYVVSFLKDLGINIPAALTSAPYNHTAPPDAGWNIWRLFTEGWTSTGAVLNVPAMIIVAIITVLLVLGIKESATFNNIIVAIKMTVILAFIAIGIAYINRENWVPFIPDATGPGQFGWHGIVRGAGVIFFAYIGFDAVSTAAQEARNAQRDMPIGILCSLAICTVLYIAVALVLTGIVKYTELNVPDPIAVASTPSVTASMASTHRQDRRHRGPFLGHPRHDDGPAPDLLHHVQGRIAAAGVLRGPSPVPHPLAGHHPHRHHRDACRRPVPNRPAGRIGLHRHAAGFCHRLRRRPGAAFHRPANSPPVPHPAGLAGLSPGSRLLPVSDVRPAAGHLGAADRVDGHRHGDLFLLRPAALQGGAWQYQVSDVGRVGRLTCP